MTRSTARLASLASGADLHVASVAGASVSAIHAAELVTKFAWSGRTELTRDSQWKAWVEFCAEDDRQPLPVTEGSLLAFIGWLKMSKERGTRSVGSSSIPQYLSAVRRMHELYTGRPVPTYPFVDVVIRAYGKWEEQQYPKESVRCGIDATIMLRVWNLGMHTPSLYMLRDCAVCVFTYCMNGLRESSTMSMEAVKVHFRDDELLARLCYWKGRRASNEPLVSYCRVSREVSSPMDLFKRWDQSRGNHVRFFGMSGEPEAYQKESLTRALSRCLDALSITPPADGKFTSHSLRIGAHTEQVLLGIPLPVRMARFGWGKNSEEMATLYFDRTIRTSGASVWFFGAQYMSDAAVSSLPATVSIGSSGTASGRGAGSSSDATAAPTS